MAEAIGSQSLLSIYGVYEKLKGKSTASTAGVSSASEGRPSTPTTKTDASPAPSSTNSTTPESESLKSQGNAAMAQKNYSKAVDLYTKAISIAPANPIYLSNRAAAYSAEHKHTEAVADAEMAVAADPKYTKAWSRLGLARFVLGDARGSMEAYEKGIEAEGHGGSEAMKKGYRTAKEKVEEQEREANTPGMAEDVDDAPGSTRGPGASGMPDLSALAGIMGGGGGGRGGMPDMSAIMNNPMFAGMAQNLMSNPQALQGLMNNPQLRQMAQQFGSGGAGGPGAGEGAGTDGGAPGGGARGGGGGGGGPDLASLMNDPSIAEM